VRNTSADANSGHEPTQTRTMHYQYVFMCDNIYHKDFLLFRLLEVENPYYQLHYW